MCTIIHTHLRVYRPKGRGLWPFPRDPVQQQPCPWPGEDRGAPGAFFLPSSLVSCGGGRVRITFSLCKSGCQPSNHNKGGTKARQIALLTELKGPVGESLATYQVISHPGSLLCPRSQRRETLLLPQVSSPFSNQRLITRSHVRWEAETWGLRR